LNHKSRGAYYVGNNSNLFLSSILSKENLSSGENLAKVKKNNTRMSIQSKFVGFFYVLFQSVQSFSIGVQSESQMHFRYKLIY
jgi:hypothetical protein